MKHETCIFCKIVAGDIPSVKVWEDDDFLAFLDVKPVKPGHTLLIPKCHQKYIFNIPDESYSALWLKAKELAPVIQKAMGSKRIGVAVEGISVDHTHIHLIPVNDVGDVDPNNQKTVDLEDLEKVAEKIQAEILK